GPSPRGSVDVGAAGLLLLTPRLRHQRGPALRGAPLPVTATVLSVLTHAVLGAGIFFAATQWSMRQPKTYVVNLVPAVAAVGTPQGAGAVTVTTSDFAFAWYIGAVQRKINERWDMWAQPGRQPVAVFAIGRDGRITGLAIEKTSGNPYYDQKALRAINDAVPF